MAARPILILFLFPILLLSCRRAPTVDAPEIRLGYFANLTHAQAVLGVSTGDIAAAVAPARLSTKVFNAGPSLIEALFANEIDIAYVGPGPILAANERTAGRGIRVISGSAANGVVIVARADSNVHSLADLANAKLATPQHGNTQDIAARHYLQSTLHQPNLNNILPITNAEQPALMSRGQIDAAWVPEPWGTRLIAENGARLIAEEKDLWPDHRFALTLVITTPEFLAAHPDLVEKFLRVHHLWTERLRTDPARYAPALDSALAAMTGKKLPAGVVASSLPRIEFTDDPIPTTFELLGQWSHELNFLKRDPRLDRLFDTSILQRIAAAPPSSTERSTLNVQR